MRTIHVWAQSFEANPGGIQTFTRFLVQAVCELYPEAEIVVFAKNDSASKLCPAVTSQQSAVRQDGDWFAPRSIVGFGKWPSALRAAAFAFSAVRHARRDQPDLIISTHVNLAPVARLAKKFSSARFAVVGHGIDVWKIHKASVRSALQAADQLLAVSDFTRVRMAEQLGVSKDRIALLPNTFDEERFSPGPKSEALLQRYRLSKEQPVILTVARMEATEQYKGYENVLLALPEVLARFPEARYLIVGDGPDKRRLGALSKELRVQDKVIFAGYVPNEELPEHYNLCDVFAMPSKGEGFGIVFLEALGCGKPVIAGNKDASVEPLLGGKLGKLVDPDSVEQIAEAICLTLSDIRNQTSEIRAEKVERLRSEVTAAFGYERFKERLGAILAPLIVIR
jgi:glycosyltransferase involved in cell wall biosynthesis